jgi:hypothetical protein
MTYKDTADNGAIVTVKSEDLVMASSYTEAEAIAYKLSEGKDEFGEVSIEIIKTKIDEIAFNEAFLVDEHLTCGLVTYYFEDTEETEVGLYQTQITFYDLDERTGKTKSTTETIFVPANSSSEAIENIHKYLKQVQETREYSIRNVKYDKAQSVMVSVEEHQKNIGK